MQWCSITITSAFVIILSLSDEKAMLNMSKILFIINIKILGINGNTLL